MHTDYVKFNYEGIDDLESLVPIIEAGAKYRDDHSAEDYEPHYCNLIKNYK